MNAEKDETRQTGAAARPAWLLCPFGERAEARRRARGIPKAELCRRLGISVTYYDLIIHGRRPGKAHRARILQMAGGGYTREA